jgi:hypothetical protein
MRGRQVLYKNNGGRNCSNAMAALPVVSVLALNQLDTGAQRKL